MSKFPLHASMVAWGEAHVDLMLRMALPSLAAPGNLPYLAEKTDLTVDFYTRGADVERIQAHPAFKALNQITPLNVVPLVDSLPPRPYPHHTMNDCHRHALLKANKARAPILLLLADILASDGLGRLIHRTFEAGQRVVVTQGMRLKQEPVLQFLRRKFGEDAPVANLSPRELVALGLETVHPYCGHQFIDHPRFVYSAELYWSLGKKGFLARNFGLHPLALWPENPAVQADITVDDVYVGKAVPSFNSYHVICDSDEGALFSVTPEKKMLEGIPAREHPFSPVDFAFDIARLFQSKNLGQLHLHYFSKKIRVHSGPMEEAEWREVEQESDEVVKRVLESLRWHLAKFNLTYTAELNQLRQQALLIRAK